MFTDRQLVKLYVLAFLGFCSGALIALAAIALVGFPWAVLALPICLAWGWWLGGALSGWVLR